MANNNGEAVPLTLEQAIRDKYSIREVHDDGVEHIKEYALNCKPGTHPVERRTSIVLDCKGVCQVADVKDLSELCPRVEEIHLVSNSITQWKDITKILSSMPRLNFLNVGQNPLDSSTFISNGMSHDHLSTLVLNGTGINLVAVEVCLKSLPRLQELHISMNDYCDVHFSPTFNHRRLCQLHINSNKINTWEGFRNLSRAFPSLETLVASGNPIEDVSVINLNDFPNLRALHMNDSSLLSWKSIECLNALRKLKELSVLNIPIGNDMKLKERRYSLIARLPKVQKLNKSEVTDEEREAAEKWVISKFKDSPDPPSIYQDLVAKYDPLAGGNLKTPLKLQLVYDESEGDGGRGGDDVMEEPEDKEEEEETDSLAIEQVIQDRYRVIGQADFPFNQRTSISLEGTGVCRVDDVMALSELCPVVEELHLASNQISHWKEMNKILCSLQYLNFFNLSRNPLNSSTFISNGKSHDQLLTLVLNSTGITFAALEVCLRALPQLRELHICLNDYCDVHFTPSFNHQRLHKLQISNNKISMWTGFRNLSRAFPNLETLMASDNPIKDLSVVKSEDFPNLHTLNLNEISVLSWKSLEGLNVLIKLKELSVLKIPLGKRMTEMGRRSTLIARFPRLQKLNGRVVTDGEKIDAGVEILKDSPVMGSKPDPPEMVEDMPDPPGAEVVGDTPDPPGAEVVGDTPDPPGAEVVGDTPDPPGAEVVRDAPDPAVNICSDQDSSPPPSATS